MNKKKIIVLLVLFIAIIGFTMSSVTSASLKVPTKYKTKSATNVYYESDSYYYDGEYVWSPKKGKFSNPYILEKYSGSKTKLRYTIYNNNGNKYHHTDVRKSTMKIKYKVVKSNGQSYYKTKTTTYTKIPKYGLSKALTIKGPAKSKIIIKKITWKQIFRIWNNYY